MCTGASSQELVLVPRKAQSAQIVTDVQMAITATPAKVTKNCSICMSSTMPPICG